MQSYSARFATLATVFGLTWMLGVYLVSDYTKPPVNRLLFQEKDMDVATPRRLQSWPSSFASFPSCSADSAPTDDVETSVGSVLYEDTCTASKNDGAISCVVQQEKASSFCPSTFGPGDSNLLKWKIVRTGLVGATTEQRAMAWKDGIAFAITPGLFFDGGQSRVKWKTPTIDSALGGLVYTSSYGLEGTNCIAEARVGFSFEGVSSPIKIASGSDTSEFIAPVSVLDSTLFKFDLSTPVPEASTLFMFMHVGARCNAGELKTIEHHAQLSETYTVSANLTMYTRVCGPGSFQNGDVCHPCAEGTYNPDPFVVLPEASVLNDANNPLYPCKKCSCDPRCATCPAGSTAPKSCTVQTDKNMCFIDESCREAGPRPSYDACQLCDPSPATWTHWTQLTSCSPAGVEGQPVIACQCEIDSECVPKMTFKPNSNCEMCLPQKNNSGWSVMDNACLANDGECGCWIDGVCYASGTRHPDPALSACLHCNPRGNMTHWSPLPNSCLVSDGTKCGCVTEDGCSSPFERPSDPAMSICLSCNPNVTTRGWTIDVPDACLTASGVCGCNVTSTDGNDFECAAPNLGPVGIENECLTCLPEVAVDGYTIKQGCYVDGKGTSIYSRDSVQNATGGSCGCDIDGTCFKDAVFHPEHPKCSFCDRNNPSVWSPRPFSGTCPIQGDDNLCTVDDTCTLDANSTLVCAGTPYKCELGECQRPVNGSHPPYCNGDGTCAFESRAPEQCRDRLDACTAPVNCTTVSASCPPYIYTLDAISAGRIAWDHTILRGDGLFVKSRDVVLQVLAGFENTCPGAPRFYRAGLAAVPTFAEAQVGCDHLEVLSYAGNSTSYIESLNIPNNVSLSVPDSASNGYYLVAILEVRGLLPNRTVLGDIAVENTIYRRACTSIVQLDETAPSWTMTDDPDEDSSDALDLAGPPKWVEENAANIFLGKSFLDEASNLVRPFDVSYICGKASCSPRSKDDIEIPPECLGRAVLQFGGAVDGESGITEFAAAVWSVSSNETSEEATVFTESDVGAVLMEKMAMLSPIRSSVQTVELPIVRGAFGVGLNASWDAGNTTRTCIQARNRVGTYSDRLCSNGLVWTCDPASPPRLAVLNTTESSRNNGDLFHTTNRSQIHVSFVHGEAVHAPLNRTILQVYVNQLPGFGVAPAKVDVYGASEMQSTMVIELSKSLADGDWYLVQGREDVRIENILTSSTNQTQRILVDTSPPDATGAAVFPFDAAAPWRSRPDETDEESGRRRHSRSVAPSKGLLRSTASSNDTHAALFVVGPLPSDLHSPPVTFRCGVDDAAGGGNVAGDELACGDGVSAAVDCEANATLGMLFTFPVQFGNITDGSYLRPCLVAVNSAGLQTTLRSSTRLLLDRTAPVVSNVTVSSTKARPPEASSRWIASAASLPSVAWSVSEPHSTVELTELAVKAVGRNGTTEDDDASEFFNLPWTRLPLASQTWEPPRLVATPMTHKSKYRVGVRVTNAAGLWSVAWSPIFQVDLVDPDPCSVADLQRRASDWAAVGWPDRDRLVLPSNQNQTGNASAASNGTDYVYIDTDWRSAREHRRMLFAGIDKVPSLHAIGAPISSITLTGFPCSSSPEFQVGPVVVHSNVSLLRSETRFDIQTYTDLALATGPAGIGGYCVEVRVIAASGRKSSCRSDGIRVVDTGPSFPQPIRDARPALPLEAGSNSTTVSAPGPPLSLSLASPDVVFVRASTPALAARFLAPSDTARVENVTVELQVLEANTESNWTSVTEPVAFPLATMPPFGVATNFPATGLLRPNQSSNTSAPQIDVGSDGIVMAVRLWHGLASLEEGRRYRLSVVAYNSVNITTVANSDGVVAIGNAPTAGPVDVESGVDVRAVGTALPRWGRAGQLSADEDHNVPIVASWDPRDWLTGTEPAAIGRFRICAAPASVIPVSTTLPNNNYNNATIVDPQIAKAACDPDGANSSMSVSWVFLGLNSTTRVPYSEDRTNQVVWNAISGPMLETAGLAPRHAEEEDAPAFRLVLEATDVFGRTVHSASDIIRFDRTPPQVSIDAVGIQASKTSDDATSSGRAGPLTLALHNISMWDPESTIVECAITVGTTADGTDIVPFRRLEICPRNSAENVTVLLPDEIGSLARPQLPDNARLFVRLLVRNGAGLVTTAIPVNAPNGVKVRVIAPLARAPPSVLDTRRDPQPPGSGVAFLPVRLPMLGLAPDVQATMEQTVRCAVPRVDIPFGAAENEPAHCRLRVVLRTAADTNVNASTFASNFTAWIPCGPDAPREDDVDAWEDASGETSADVLAAAGRVFMGSRNVDVTEIVRQAQQLHSETEPELDAWAVTCEVQSCAGGGRVLLDGTFAPRNATAENGGVCRIQTSERAIVDRRRPPSPSWVIDGPVPGFDLVIASSAGSSVIRKSDASPDVALDAMPASLAAMRGAYGQSGSIRAGEAEPESGVRPFIAAQWQEPRNPDAYDELETAGAPISRVETVAFEFPAAIAASSAFPQTSDLGTNGLDDLVDPACGVSGLKQVAAAAAEESVADGAAGDARRSSRDVQQVAETVALLYWEYFNADANRTRVSIQQSGDDVYSTSTFGVPKIVSSASLGADASEWIDTSVPLAGMHERRGGGIGNETARNESRNDNLLPPTTVVCVRTVSLAGVGSVPRCSDGLMVSTGRGASPLVGNLELIRSPWKISDSGVAAAEQSHISPRLGSRNETNGTTRSFQAHSSSIAISVPPLNVGTDGVGRVVLSVGVWNREKPHQGNQTLAGREHALRSVSIPALQDLPRCGEGVPAKRLGYVAAPDAGASQVGDVFGCLWTTPEGLATAESNAKARTRIMPSLFFPEESDSPHEVVKEVRRLCGEIVGSDEGLQPSPSPSSTPAPSPSASMTPSPSAMASTTPTPSMTPAPSPPCVENCIADTDDDNGGSGMSFQHGHGWGTAATFASGGVVLVIGGPGIQLRQGLDHVATLSVETRTGFVAKTAISNNVLRYDAKSPKQMMVSKPTAVRGDPSGHSPLGDLLFSTAASNSIVPKFPATISCVWFPSESTASGICRTKVEVALREKPYLPGMVTQPSIFRVALVAAPNAPAEGGRPVLWDDSDPGWPNTMGSQIRVPRGAALDPYFDLRDVQALSLGQLDVVTFGSIGTGVPLSTPFKAAVARPRVHTVGDPGMEFSQMSVDVTFGEYAQLYTALSTSVSTNETLLQATLEGARNDTQRLYGYEASCQVVETTCGGIERPAMFFPGYSPIVDGSPPSMDAGQPLLMSRILSNRLVAGREVDSKTLDVSSAAAALTDSSCGAAAACFLPARSTGVIVGYGTCLVNRNDRATAEQCSSGIRRALLARGLSSPSGASFLPPSARTRTMMGLGPGIIAAGYVHVGDLAVPPQQICVAYSRDDVPLTTVFGDASGGGFNDYPAVRLHLATHNGSSVDAPVFRATAEAFAPNVPIRVAVFAIDGAGQLSAVRIADLGRCDVTPPQSFRSPSTEPVFPAVPLVSSTELQYPTVWNVSKCEASSAIVEATCSSGMCNASVGTIGTDLNVSCLSSLRSALPGTTAVVCDVSTAWLLGQCVNATWCNSTVRVLLPEPCRPSPFDPPSTLMNTSIRNAFENVALETLERIVPSMTHGSTGLETLGGLAGAPGVRTYQTLGGNSTREFARDVLVLDRSCVAQAVRVDAQSSLATALAADDAETAELARVVASFSTPSSAGTSSASSTSTWQSSGAPLVWNLDTAENNIAVGVSGSWTDRESGILWASVGVSVLRVNRHLGNSSEAGMCGLVLQNSSASIRVLGRSGQFSADSVRVAAEATAQKRGRLALFPPQSRPFFPGNSTAAARDRVQRSRVVLPANGSTTAAIRGAVFAEVSRRRPCDATSGVGAGVKVAGFGISNVDALGPSPSDTDFLTVLVPISAAQNMQGHSVVYLGAPILGEDPASSSPRFLRPTVETSQAVGPTHRAVFEDATIPSIPVKRLSPTARRIVREQHINASTGEAFLRPSKALHPGPDAGSSWWRARDETIRCHFPPVSVGTSDAAISVVETVLLAAYEESPDTFSTWQVASLAVSGSRSNDSFGCGSAATDSGSFLLGGSTQGWGPHVVPDASFESGAQGIQVEWSTESGLSRPIGKATFPGMGSTGPVVVSARLPIEVASAIPDGAYLCCSARVWSSSGTVSSWINVTGTSTSVVRKDWTVPVLSGLRGQVVGIDTTVELVEMTLRGKSMAPKAVIDGTLPLDAGVQDSFVGRWTLLGDGSLPSPTLPFAGNETIRHFEDISCLTGGSRLGVRAKLCDVGSGMVDAWAGTVLIPFDAKARNNPDDAQQTVLGGLWEGVGGAWPDLFSGTVRVSDSRGTGKTAIPVRASGVLDAASARHQRQWQAVRLPSKAVIVSRRGVRLEGSTEVMSLTNTSSTNTSSNNTRLQPTTAGPSCLDLSKTLATERETAAAMDLIGRETAEWSQRQMDLQGAGRNTTQSSRSPHRLDGDVQWRWAVVLSVANGAGSRHTEVLIGADAHLGGVGWEAAWGQATLQRSLLGTDAARLPSAAQGAADALVTWSTPSGMPGSFCGVSSGAGLVLLDVWDAVTGEHLGSKSVLMHGGATSGNASVASIIQSKNGMDQRSKVRHGHLLRARAVFVDRSSGAMRTVSLPLLTIDEVGPQLALPAATATRSKHRPFPLHSGRVGHGWTVQVVLNGTATAPFASSVSGPPMLLDPISQSQKPDLNTTGLLRGNLTASTGFVPGSSAADQSPDIPAALQVRAAASAINYSVAVVSISPLIAARFAELVVSTDIFKDEVPFVSPRRFPGITTLPWPVPPAPQDVDPCTIETDPQRPFLARMRQTYNESATDYAACSEPWTAGNLTTPAFCPGLERSVGDGAVCSGSGWTPWNGTLSSCNGTWWRFAGGAAAIESCTDPCLVVSLDQKATELARVGNQLMVCPGGTWELDVVEFGCKFANGSSASATKNQSDCQYNWLPVQVSATCVDGQPRNLSHAFCSSWARTTSSNGTQLGPDLARLCADNATAWYYFGGNASACEPKPCDLIAGDSNTSLAFVNRTFQSCTTKWNATGHTLECAGNTTLVLGGYCNGSWIDPSERVLLKLVRTGANASVASCNSTWSKFAGGDVESQCLPRNPCEVVTLGPNQLVNIFENASLAICIDRDQILHEWTKMGTDYRCNQSLGWNESSCLANNGQWAPLHYVPVCSSNSTMEILSHAVCSDNDSWIPFGNGSTVCSSGGWYYFGSNASACTTDPCNPQNISRSFGILASRNGSLTSCNSSDGLAAWSGNSSDIWCTPGPEQDIASAECLGVWRRLVDGGGEQNLVCDGDWLLYPCETPAAKATAPIPSRCDFVEVPGPSMLQRHNTSSSAEICVNGVWNTHHQCVVNGTVALDRNESSCSDAGMTWTTASNASCTSGNVRIERAPNCSDWGTRYNGGFFLCNGTAGYYHDAPNATWCIPNSCDVIDIPSTSLVRLGNSSTLQSCSNTSWYLESRCNKSALWSRVSSTDGAECTGAESLVPVCDGVVEPISISETFCNNFSVLPNVTWNESAVSICTGSAWSYAGKNASLCNPCRRVSDPKGPALVFPNGSAVICVEGVWNMSTLECTNGSGVEWSSPTQGFRCILPQQAPNATNEPALCSSWSRLSGKNTSLCPIPDPCRRVLGSSPLVRLNGSGDSIVTCSSDAMISKHFGSPICPDSFFVQAPETWTCLSKWEPISINGSNITTIHISPNESVSMDTLEQCSTWDYAASKNATQCPPNEQPKVLLPWLRPALEDARTLSILGERGTTLRAKDDFDARSQLGCRLLSAISAIATQNMSTSTDAGLALFQIVQSVLNASQDLEHPDSISIDQLAHPIRLNNTWTTSGSITLAEMSATLSPDQLQTVPANQSSKGSCSIVLADAQSASGRSTTMYPAASILFDGLPTKSPTLDIWVSSANLSSEARAWLPFDSSLSNAVIWGLTSTKNSSLQQSQLLLQAESKETKDYAGELSIAWVVDGIDEGFLKLHLCNESCEEWTQAPLSQQSMTLPSNSSATHVLVQVLSETHQLILEQSHQIY